MAYQKYMKPLLPTYICKKIAINSINLINNNNMFSAIEVLIFTLIC